VAPSGGKVKGRSASAWEINTALDLIKKQVYDYKAQILSENRRFTIDTLREKWFGEDRNQRTLLGVLTFQKEKRQYVIVGEWMERKSK
jgi:hypothetical protein